MTIDQSAGLGIGEQEAGPGQQARPGPERIHDCEEEVPVQGVVGLSEVQERHETGPPLLGPEVERHLFEPFYSTRSRGSGLGLTICRELCERYGARIDYQPQTVDGQAVVGFAITLRRAPRAESAP